MTTLARRPLCRDGAHNAGILPAGCNALLVLAGPVAPSQANLETNKNARSPPRDPPIHYFSLFFCMFNCLVDVFAYLF